MKKLLIVLAILFIAGVTGLVILGSMFLGTAAKEAVNLIGPKLTQTELKVDSVSINPFLGNGSLKGFLMGNPDGFEGDTAIALDSIKLNVDVGSLFSGDTIVINEIHILGPKVAYERTFRSSNVAEILKNVEAFQKSIVGTSDETIPSEPVENSEGTTPSETAPDIKFIIKELIVDGGEVGMTVAGQTLALPMPRIEQRDIGVAQGGVSPNEAFGEILNAMLKSIGTATAEASKRIANDGAGTVKRIGEGIGSIFGSDN